MHRWRSRGEADFENVEKTCILTLKESTESDLRPIKEIYDSIFKNT